MACGRHRGALHHADFALEILTAERLVKRAEKRDKERDAKIRRLRRQRAAEGGGGDDVGAGAGGGDGSPGVGGAQQGDESHIAMYDGEADGASVGGDTVGTAVRCARVHPSHPNPTPLDPASPCVVLPAWTRCLLLG